MNKPECTIVAGPNGAGKTTFAMNYFAEEIPPRRFLNADIIAAGLSALSPDLAQVDAARVFLDHVDQAIERRENFAFETTLAGRTHFRRVTKMREQGWEVHLLYLYLPSIDTSKSRVAERVLHGGHDIPSDAIVRRYGRSLYNLVHLYSKQCSRVVVWDNSEREEKHIYSIRDGILTVTDQEMYKQVMAGAKL